MQFVPWQNIADWHCKACGYCCKLYSVVINAHEWLSMPKPSASKTPWQAPTDFSLNVKATAPALSSAKKQTPTTANCKTRSLKPAKSGPSKSFQNQNTAKQTRQPTITLACDCTFMGIPCAAAYERRANMGFPQHQNKRVH